MDSNNDWLLDILEEAKTMDKMLSKYKLQRCFPYSQYILRIQFELPYRVNPNVYLRHMRFSL